jgi:hypothetical protein
MRLIRETSTFLTYPSCKMNHIRYRYILILAALLMVVTRGSGQTALPDELTRNSIKEQINYLEEHTRIYENYRAVREDMFQKINRNFIDSLSSGKNRIAELDNLTSDLRVTNDSLYIILETTRNNLNEITATKNSIRVLGMEINKVSYNTIMWTIILVLITVLAIGFLVFKRNLFLTIRTAKELKELKEEFEAYRQSSRIAREKLEMAHFNEIKRLKAK